MLGSPKWQIFYDFRSYNTLKPDFCRALRTLFFLAEILTKSDWGYFFQNLDKCFGGGFVRRGGGGGYFYLRGTQKQMTTVHDIVQFGL